ncbi:predicted protein [Botrytis cinerea T4]|uniref:Uncharacterized protein n=1 Tax=Botryotinia fuckeliana (strain T4) TaxID=999810 RepID=G2YCH1_BOTF4|nr:predicted protein [Botrytis cinerea T4]
MFLSLRQYRLAIDIDRRKGDMSTGFEAPLATELYAN